MLHTIELAAARKAARMEKATKEKEQQKKTGVCFQQNGNRLSKKLKRNFLLPPAAPNVVIPTSIGLSCALCHFVGLFPYDDLAAKYGISNTEVMASVWFVVDAIHALPEFLADQHAQQTQITSELCAASSVNFNNCAGAIDGILIWIHRPSDQDAKKSGIGMKKQTFCGHKKKSGFNFQEAGCFGLLWPFLDISIV